MPRASLPTKLLILLAALLAILPLILHGGSCGQDLLFHVQSWLDAATQLRLGHYPHWDITAAWNAGEPRFLFYPPISWLLGAILTMIFPIAACPTIFIAIALLASGLAFYKFASHFVSPNAALIASALYLANPYMLFNAFERSALAELLAAAWIPLLLFAILRARPTIRGIAVPLALLWLTNAPAAVIGSYALAILAILRVATSLLSPRTYPANPNLSQSGAPSQSHHPEPKLCEPSAPPPQCHPERSDSRTMRIAESKDPPPTQPGTPAGTFQPKTPRPLRLTLTYLAGTAMGLALPAFYLIPAAFERRFIQVNMALIPNLRPQDNFLFTHTTDAAHNAVNHTASLLALTLLILTAATLLALFLFTNRRESAISTEARSLDPVISTEGRRSQRSDPQTPPHLAFLLLLSTALIIFFLTPLSLPIWRHLPELAFLQFPWRLLTLLTPILALTIALLLDALTHTQPSGAPDPTLGNRVRKTPNIPILTTALILPLALGLYTFHLFHQFCDPTDNPTTLAHNLATHHGVLPTDEYTPTNADNNLLRSDNPGFWLIPQARNQPQTQPANSNTPAPRTLPTATELNPSIDTDDTPIPLDQTISTPAPHHLTLNITHPAILVLNLRDYPSWRVTNLRSPELPPHLQRADGLLAVPLLDGPATIDITWHRSTAQSVGLTVSALALLILLLTYSYRRINQLSPSAKDRRT